MCASKKERVFLVDGTALAYRSHFAFIRNPLTDSQGRQTGAVFGFVQSLRRLIDTEKPDALAVVFDAKGPTFRHEVFGEYKATRQKMDEALVEQIPTILEVVDAWSIPRLEVAGYEADDVIATLARRVEEQGKQCFIVSGDKDFAQLVTPSIKLYQPGRQGSEVEILGPAEVEQKFGVPPERIIDLLALMGDSSDNVPGVPGIGPKTACKLVQELGDLEGVLAGAETLKAKSTRQSLLDHADTARLSRDLVTVRTDVPLELDVADLFRREPDQNALNEIYTRLEFHSLVEKIELRADTDEHGWHVVKSREELEDLLERLSSSRRFVFDTETTGLDPLRSELVGLSFAFEPREAYYVPLNADPPLLGRSGDLPGLEREQILERLRPVLENPDIGKSGQNVKYDLLALSSAGIQVRGVDFDTMIASYLLDPGLRLHNLDVLARRFLGYGPIPIQDLIGKGKDQISMADVSVERVGEYACEDADLTLRLEQAFRPRILEMGLGELFDTIEVPLIEILAGMERTGVRLDVDLLAGMSGSMGEKLATLEKEIWEICGEEFNIASPKQLGEVLFDRLEIHRDGKNRKPRKTKTGYSTDSRTLDRFADHPAVGKVLEHRSISKLKGTYVDALPALVNPKTGRLHTSYNQAVAATGRLSSSDPNLQNIPIRTALGREIRKAFLPGEEGRLLLSADYSQIELRIMAHLSGDEELKRCFAAGEDVHRATAATIFGVDPASVDLEMRSKAKAVNFGLMYGMGPHRLAADTGITVLEAQAFIDAYFRSFPGIKIHLERCLEEARETGLVRTLLGRQRPIPEIHSSDGRVRSNAENMAVNTPIQGSAADLIKKAMIRLDRRLAQERVGARMILQVHDELVLDVPEAEVDRVTTAVKEEMEGAFELSVPIVVDVATGKNWYEAHA
jgi:DNA polymerase-1